MAIKVSQSVIDEIKKKGMGKAISEANSGNASAEFVEGAKRMYGKRVSGPLAGDVKAKETDTATATSEGPKPVPMPPSAPAAAQRATGSKREQAIAAVNESLGRPNKPKGSSPRSQAIDRANKVYHEMKKNKPKKEKKLSPREEALKKVQESRK